MVEIERAELRGALRHAYKETPAEAAGLVAQFRVKSRSSNRFEYAATIPLCYTDLATTAVNGKVDYLRRAFLPDPLLIRISIASVWLYEGLWCKLLGRAPHQESVVESVPFFSPRFAHFFLMAIGVIECCFGVWTLTGWRLWWAALAQTAFLASLNTGGILWARRIIHDPAGMLVKNFVFVILMWVAAAQPPR